METHYKPFNKTAPLSFPVKISNIFSKRLREKNGQKSEG